MSDLKRSAKMISIKTVSKWKTAGLAGTCLIAIQPVFSYLHYSWNLKMGAYPTNADSIGIPIYDEFIGWLVFAPIALIGLWWAVWKAPGPRSIWEWNNKRPIWCIIWSVIFSLLAIATAIEIPFALRWLNIPTVINDTLLIYLYLHLRVNVAFKKFIIE
jgi:hypothetical protein